MRIYRIRNGYGNMYSRIHDVEAAEKFLHLWFVKCLHSAFACVYMCARVCVWCVC